MVERALSEGCGQVLSGRFYNRIIFMHHDVMQSVPIVRSCMPTHSRDEGGDVRCVRSTWIVQYQLRCFWPLPEATRQVCLITYGLCDPCWYTTGHARHFACHMNRDLDMNFGRQSVQPGCSTLDSKAVPLLNSSWTGFRSHTQSGQTQIIDKRRVSEHVGVWLVVLFQNWRD
jgi:hypothetical protein